MKTGWTIGKKLIASFMAVATVTLLLGIVGYYGVSEGGKSIDEIGVVRLPSVQSLLVISQAQTGISSAENALLSPGQDADGRQEAYQRFVDGKKRADDALKVYEALPHTPEEAEIWKKFVPAWETWWKAHEDYAKMAREFEALGIPNPPALQRDMQQFVGDHYKLASLVLEHVTHGAECQGGDDPTACNYGKWAATFDSTNPELRQLIDTIRPAHDAFHAAVKKVKELAAAGDQDGAAAVISGELQEVAEKTREGFASLVAVAAKGNELSEKMNHEALVTNRATLVAAREQLNKLLENNTTAAEKTVKTSTDKAAFLKALSLVAMIVGVVAALGLGILISRGINNALRRIAASLGGGAEQTASAAGQVSQSSQSMAEGASEQASSLEETSASLEELTSMTKQNADNANQAKNLSGAANASANKGAQAMAKMSAAIDEIKTSSGATAKIIKTIDEIAFQTNLLALNAAVEAARAGDAGKGFAVVAEEVRNLAQRSAEAAKNTSAMIEESVKSAENGVLISREVAEALKEIADVAGKVNALVAEIASASNEQAQGIEQVNTAVAQMDQVTQSNAANSEESASASEELSAQAEEMNRMVQELVAMVGGANGKSHHGNGRHAALAAPKTARHAIAHVAMGGERRQNAKPVARAHAALTDKRGAARVVDPESVIPLDDKDLAEF